MIRRAFLATSTAFAAATAFSIPAFAGSRSGNFSGNAGHTTTGSVTVKGGKIILENNFSFDGAPDPRVGLGKGGKYVSGTDFAVLKKNNGKQTYFIPANLKDRDFDTIVIWCRKFSVQLGKAKLN